MPFLPADSPLDLVAIEHRVLDHWRRHHVFHESLARREGAPRWVFYEGPPTANGRPGLHHVWARAFKDLFPRFQTMRGRYVSRKGGWDCHGLPVELEVEKELGLAAKDEIEAYGIEAFNLRCRDSVHRYVAEWEALTARIGMWLDTEDAYWTLSNEFIESVWWLFKQMWENDLLYEGFKVVPYCGRCGTALSSHEVALGYRDIAEPSVYVRFPVVDADFDLLVWTTTPWTLVSNVAVALGPAIDYVRARGAGGGRDLVLARARVAAVLGEDAEIVDDIPTSELAGLAYLRPFDVLPLDPATPRAVLADFVTIEDGSGIVHLAPAFGEIDREVGVAQGLPVLNPVDTGGRFDASVPRYEGMFVKDADGLIIEDLTAAGRLFAAVEHTHSYPHCWRCSTPLVYYAKTSWFARTSSMKEAMLVENDAVGWHPEHIRQGRFGDWLENNVDWALSRDRYWGTPLPIWRCVGPEHHDTCVGSVAELSALAGRALHDLDLHRPFVDQIELPCPSCGAQAQRLTPVLDAWFDSGSMPAAQFHYPFDTPGEFDASFPADFICEAIDQTRGWFYSLLAVNTLVFGRSPYRNVVCLAHVVDKDGQKMSKSKGNVIDPWTILDTHGADALRWYFFSAGSPWTNRRVYEEGIEESTRRFLLTLWNTYSFFLTYANIDGWEPVASPAPAPTHMLDRWIKARLATTVRTVTDALEGFDALAASQALELFVDDLSNWYVRRSRPRFWKAAEATAHATLHECLVTFAKLLAPLCPFVAEEIYRNLTLGAASLSVHMEDWPTCDTAASDDALEVEMALVRSVVALGRAARGEAKVRVRQPLARALVLLPAGAQLSEDGVQQVAEELNVKHVQVVATLDDLISYSVVPNFRTLGPRLGSAMPSVKAALAAVDGASVRAALDRDGRFELSVGRETFALGPEDVEVRAEHHEELALTQDGPYAVAIDLVLDGALEREGLARELVRALNDHRKGLGLAIADRVLLSIRAAGRINDALLEHRDWVAGEVLATELHIIDPAAPVDALAELVIDGESVGVHLEVIS